MSAWDRKFCKAFSQIEGSRSYGLLTIILRDVTIPRALDWPPICMIIDGSLVLATIDYLQIVRTDILRLDTG